MDTARLFAALVCLSAVAAIGAATDLGQIDRTIAREPAYRGKPLYCLLVFGPEAKTRVWLALDPKAKCLYVDRNGNGDLTEKGERFVPVNHNLDLRCYEVGEIGGDGRTKYLNLKVDHVGTEEGARGFFVPEMFSLSVEVNGKLHGVQLKAFGEKPKDAPVVHVDGPLTFSLYDGANQTLVRGDQPSTLTVHIGTRGAGRGTFTTIPIDRPPADAHPVAVIEFPASKPGAKPLTAEVILDQRC